MKNSTLWISDPWLTLDHANDSTLRFITEAQLLGRTALWTDVHSLAWDSQNETTYYDAYTLTIEEKIPNLKKIPSPPPLQSFEQIHYRVDPPIDQAYLGALQLLECAGLEKKISNPFLHLYARSEKLEGLQVGAEICPPSYLGTQWAQLLSFGKKEQLTVAKPLNEAQSKGVVLLDWRTTDGVEAAFEKLQSLSQSFSRPVVLQKYLSGIQSGETRLWFSSGKFLECIRKLPLPGDFRVQIDGGSKLLPHELSLGEKKVLEKIESYLKKVPIKLLAVDLIEEKITDFNFTSPGLIPQMEKVLEKNLAQKIQVHLF